MSKKALKGSGVLMVLVSTVGCIAAGGDPIITGMCALAWLVGLAFFVVGRL